MFRCSSISLTSLRASSTGWTFVRNARPNTPSKSDSSFVSMLRRTDIGGGVVPRQASLCSPLEGQDRGGQPGGGHERKQCGLRGDRCREAQQGSGEDHRRPRPTSAGVRESGRGGGEDERF